MPPALPVVADFTRLPDEDLFERRDRVGTNDAAPAPLSEL